MAKPKSKKSKKGKKKGKKGNPVPKSLRKGALPTSVSDVIAAGLGALRDAQASGGEQFDALVRRGQSIQESGSRAVREAAEDVEGAVDRVLGAMRSTRGSVVEGVQDRAESIVKGVMSGLGVPTRDEVRALQAMVDTLEKRIQALGSRPGGARAVYSVQSRPDGWAVQNGGDVLEVRSTKKQAIVRARALAREHAPSTLTIYKLDGAVSDTTDYEA